MCPQFIFSLEHDEALLFASLVRTDEVSLCEMDLQAWVICIVSAFMLVSAYMASHVYLLHMWEEFQVVETELLAKVTVRMWKDLSIPVITKISILNMTPELLGVVQSLLSDEHSSTFKADLTKSLLMIGFHVSL